MFTWILRDRLIFLSHCVRCYWIWLCRRCEISLCISLWSLSFSAVLVWLGFFKFFSESRLAQSQAGMCRHVYIRWKLVSVGDGQTGCKNCDETGEAIKAISVLCIKRLVHAASQDRRLVYNMYIRFNLKHLDFPLTLVSLCRKSRQSERRQRDSCSSKSLNPVSL